MTDQEIDAKRVNAAVKIKLSLIRRAELAKTIAVRYQELAKDLKRLTSEMSGIEYGEYIKRTR